MPSVIEKQWFSTVGALRRAIEGIPDDYGVQTTVRFYRPDDCYAEQQSPLHALVGRAFSPPTRTEPRLLNLKRPERRADDIPIVSAIKDDARYTFRNIPPRQPIPMYLRFLCPTK